MNTTTGEPCDSGPLRKKISETTRIEMRQSKLLKTNQSQQSIMLYNITLELPRVVSLSGRMYFFFNLNAA